MSNVIAQFHKGKYVNKPIQLGTTLAKDVILEDGDSVDAKFRRLKCNSNGELSFKGKNVVRSVNGVNADENGNVQLASKVRYVNYSAGISLANGVACPDDGFVLIVNPNRTNGVYSTINGSNVVFSDGYGQQITVGAMAPIHKGDIVNGGRTTFYPFATSEN